MPKFIFTLALFLISLFLTNKVSFSYYESVTTLNPTSGQVLGLSAFAQEPLATGSALPTPLPEDISISPPRLTTPDKPFYFFKTSLENIQLFLTFDPLKKQEYRSDLANERLSEIKYLLDNGATAKINQLSSVYNELLSELQESLKKLKSQGHDVSALAAKTGKQAVLGQIFAESLDSSADSSLTVLRTILLSSSQKILDTSADVRSETPIPDELRLSIENLAKDGILNPEQTSLLFSLKSREEVRKELNKLNEQGYFPLVELKKIDLGVKENFPEHYQKTIENLKYSELKSYGSLSLDKDLLASLEEAQKVSKEGIGTTNLKNKLILKRIAELSRELDFARLEPEQRSEIGGLFATFVKDNPTFESSQDSSPVAKTGAKCPSGWSYASDNGGWCKANSGNNARPPKWELPICDNASFWFGGECVLFNKPATSSSSSPSPSASTSTASSKCPNGWHYVTSSTPWCEADQGNTSPAPTWSLPICTSGSGYNGSSCISGSESEWCPSGWTYKLLAGGSNGWCAANAGNTQAVPSNWKVPICALDYDWDGKTCVKQTVASPTTTSATEACPTYQETGTIFTYKAGYGCVYSPGTWGYCGPNYYWMGNACAKPTSGQIDCGAGFDRSVITDPCFEMYPPNCPTGWSWQASNGGWCKANSGNSSAVPSKWSSQGHVNICASGTSWGGSSCVVDTSP